MTTKAVTAWDASLVFFGEEVRLVPAEVYRPVPQRGEARPRAFRVPTPPRTPKMRPVPPRLAGVLWVLYDAPERFTTAELGRGVHRCEVASERAQSLLSQVRWELARRGMGSIVREQRKLRFVWREEL